MPLADRKPTASFRAVIPAKARMEIFFRRKPGTRLVPVFQQGDEGARDPRFRGGKFSIPVLRGIALVNQRPHLL